MDVKVNNIKDSIKNQILILDGAYGTEIQKKEIPSEAWIYKGLDNDGCNELLNLSAPNIIKDIYSSYITAGANIITSNTFGTMPWVLDEYDIPETAYELSRLGVKLIRECIDELNPTHPVFVAGGIGPGTKLPSLGHIDYDEMYDGYSIMAEGLIDGGCDLFLLETAQDPLQIKVALHACEDVAKKKGVDIPIMVSATIELTGSMLIGTDAATLATILEPFDILSLGFNCGTGPAQVKTHLEDLSKVWNRPISVHANAGLPENRGGCTHYPMGPDEFVKRQNEFLDIDGIAVLGGCCGSTPEHIEKLAKSVKGKIPLKPIGSHEKSIASLYEPRELIQNPSPFLVGERSNATGSKAFKDLLLAEEYDKTLSVATEQVRNGAHGIDLSVGFAGRDENKDMKILASLYASKVSLPLMIDTTQVDALEIGLKCIGSKPIINSVNLEDGEEKFDKVCSLAKKHGASLVCLTIDEVGMAKTKQEKVAQATRIYELCTKRHGLDGRDLVFDMLTFTVGSGDAEYFSAAIETIEAIREFHELYPEVGFVLGISNISFGLDKKARFYLNSVFLHLCVEAGLSMAIVNVTHTLPMYKISEEDRIICEDLLLDRRDTKGDVLMNFIRHFENADDIDEQSDEEYEALSTSEKIHKLLVDGEKERMLELLPSAKDEIEADEIVNVVLINAMKEVGELFGSGKMQLPFVLQSAEVMKTSVDWLNPYLPKKEKTTTTTLIIGTVKGDVHDVGKNLVDIILTNNGFKVINLGIKVDISKFIETYNEHKADAIGMSGLLVKSTAVMKENLEKLKGMGIKIPILLGGAALNREFINDFCIPNYDGPIFYCKDAFDGVEAMKRIEASSETGAPLDTNLGNEDKDGSVARREKRLAKKKAIAESINIKYEDVILPTKNSKKIIPPFWGRKIFDTDKVKELAFNWINHKLLFSQRWGYNSKGLDKNAKIKQKAKLWEDFEELKAEILEKNLFNPKVVYGYFPVRADDRDLLIFDPKEGFHTEDQRNKENLEDIRARATHKFGFPRQSKSPYRAITDYYNRDSHDVMPLTCVSAGDAFAEYEAKLYANHEYNKYNKIHGIGIDLAEALAEVIHKQIRIELGITDVYEKPNLRDVNMRKYTGCRYSFGYPACPDLSYSKDLFELLRPEELGIVLSETFQMHPEQSTNAIVCYHEEAKYFSV
ncbi:MAG: 5-methyltetrahydrofolate--homocysteine methyltransferase (EC [uncultured Campylobacterales bacterium]|uniref:Methionine synthase n=1 Tax=uncultured Campylobacterales bacterium TaxID=352960 RepID=A0A6S6TA37_9BACT|nr:MAG: 5-methyltetrahydrofolate--homocysteine methyltransferase (EC [uncultured Campylobacterales bacterium]